MFLGGELLVVVLDCRVFLLGKTMVIESSCRTFFWGEILVTGECLERRHLRGLYVCLWYGMHRDHGDGDHSEVSRRVLPEGRFSGTILFLLCGGCIWHVHRKA